MEPGVTVLEELPGGPPPTAVRLPGAMPPPTCECPVGPPGLPPYPAYPP